MRRRLASPRSHEAGGKPNHGSEGGAPWLGRAPDTVAAGRSGWRSTVVAAVLYLIVYLLFFTYGGGGGGGGLY